MMTEKDWEKFHRVYDHASPEAQDKIQAIFREYGTGQRDLTEEETDQASALLADILTHDWSTRHSRKRSLTSMLRTLRDAGWMVGVHNDYRKDGKFYTFWLFTHPKGVYLKGEAERDEEAVFQVLDQAHRLKLLA